MPDRHSIPRAATVTPEILEAVVETFKAVADSTRAQLVFLLTQREYSVNELAERAHLEHVHHNLPDQPYPTLEELTETNEPS